MSAAPILQLETVSVRIGELEVLPPTSFSLHSGEVALITGESGSGKSTLLRAIAGLITPTFGEVRISFDSEISPPQSVPSARLAYSPQDFGLWDFMTIAENVKAPLAAHGMKGDAANSVVERELSRLDLRHVGDLYPEQVSGGERQRASLARAVALSPQLLMVDEPTSNLDGSRAELVWGTLKAMREMGAAIVIVSHQPISASLDADVPIHLGDQ